MAGFRAAASLSHAHPNRKALLRIAQSRLAMVHKHAHPQSAALGFDSWFKSKVTGSNSLPNTKREFRSGPFF